MRVGGSARAARDGGSWAACVAIGLRLDIVENWGREGGDVYLVISSIYPNKCFGCDDNVEIN